jgi:hypothetical protein
MAKEERNLHFFVSMYNKKMKDTVLFISQPIYEDKICAIGITGKLFADAILLSDKYNVMHFYSESGDKIIDLYNQYKPKVIFYMFCSRTTQWMMDTTWKTKVPCKHLVLDADVTQRSINAYNSENFYNFDALISIDPSLDVNFTSNVYKVNHIMPNVVAGEYIETGKTRIGFHGSPTFNKGILELVDFVQNEFDVADLVFHCPLHFPNNGHTPIQFMNNINTVKSKIYKPGIEFKLTTDIISNQELVNRLSKNTINCYLNQDGPYNLTGSAIHTALAAKRPIAIRKSRASMGYLGLNPSICIEDNSLKTIINNGFKPLMPLYEKYSPVNVCRDFENIIKKVLLPPGIVFSF